MRTTIDLPDDLHRQALSIARDTSRTLSETVADLVRRGLGQGRAPEIFRSAVAGLPVVRLGTAMTSEDVRALEDDLPRREVGEFGLFDGNDVPVGGPQGV